MIGAGTLLYQATGNPGYLFQARQTAKAALAYFTSERLGQEIPFFPSVYFRNLLYLDSVTHDAPGPDDRPGLRRLRLAAPAPEERPVRRRLAGAAPSCSCRPRSCRSTRCCPRRRAPTSERALGASRLCGGARRDQPHDRRWSCDPQRRTCRARGGGAQGDRRSHQDGTRVGRSEGEQRVPRRQERSGPPRDEDRPPAREDRRRGVVEEAPAVAGRRGRASAPRWSYATRTASSRPGGS